MSETLMNIDMSLYEFINLILFEILIYVTYKAGTRIVVVGNEIKEIKPEVKKLYRSNSLMEYEMKVNNHKNSEFKKLADEFNKTPHEVAIISMNYLIAKDVGEQMTLKEVDERVSKMRNYLEEEKAR